ncbi:uncharacterized protein FOMMEDRAFT_158998 [Fomitiporia mediterranea MF3/22]|uniref:uncharacterized protein n=1 Tax=Fomitiporia mediterranea (strain MF3/22) TaxID=694068 RepID=UPI0004408588|nr:uncharacterized protein FOMMEDRAFT_158998 [Fomitiporia mediterranea MF3/22]EJD00326.1 hypothetical protein FOMMEDRAFT_158998 [Fomitiporia mediterranea MF3/22]
MPSFHLCCLDCTLVIRRIWRLFLLTFSLVAISMSTGTSEFQTLALSLILKSRELSRKFIARLSKFSRETLHPEKRNPIRPWASGVIFEIGAEKDKKVVDSHACSLPPSSLISHGQVQHSLSSTPPSDQYGALQVRILPRGPSLTDVLSVWTVHVALGSWI